jgi:hypothetical protein
MARPHWFGYWEYIQKDVQQVVLLASGVTGIAPMLQTIHTLLEARRGDGIERRTLDIHVVWFKQNQEHVNENGMAPSYAKSLEASTTDKIASAELERFRLLHPDKLVIESVDVDSTFAQGTQVIGVLRCRFILCNGYQSLTNDMTIHITRYVYLRPYCCNVYKSYYFLAMKSIWSI